MKKTSNIFAVALMLTVASQGATVISGALGGSFKAVDGTTNIPTGALVMLVADTGTGTGFLDLSAQGAVAPGLTGLSGKTITAAQAGIIVGSSFGGETVVATTLAGSGGSISTFLPSADISSYVTKNFAVIWFNVAPATVASNIAGGIATNFGMIRLSDWVFPGSDGGTFSMSPTDASTTTSYYSTSTATTATQVGGGFFTGSGTAADTGSTAVRSAQFSIVPEPSSALLGALGVLGLLRRRRA